MFSRFHFFFSSSASEGQSASRRRALLNWTPFQPKPKPTFSPPSRTAAAEMFVGNVGIPQEEFLIMANGSQKRQVSAQKASETERASFPRADEREAPRGELVGHQAGAVGRSRAADQNRVFRKLRNSQQQKKKSMSTSPPTPTSPGSEPIRRALREVDKNLRDVQKLCSRKSSKVQVSLV